MYLPMGAAASSVEEAFLASAGLSSLKDMCTLMKPPSPAAEGLNISNHLSMGTASKMSSTKIPAKHIAYCVCVLQYPWDSSGLAKGCLLQGRAHPPGFTLVVSPTFNCITDFVNTIHTTVLARTMLDKTVNKAACSCHVFEAWMQMPMDTGSMRLLQGVHNVC